MMRNRRFLCFLLSVLLLTGGVSTRAAEGGFDAFVPRNTYSVGLFQDIGSDWYTENVATAYELGLMKGKGDGIFDPDAGITLAETITVAAIIHSIYHTGQENFSADADVWYRPYLDYADEHGIVRYFQADLIYEDYNNGTWSTPVTRLATRAQFAGILAKALPEEALSPMNELADDSLPDIGTADHYGQDVYLLYRAGVLAGSDDYGTFHPNSTITRKEVAAILARMVDPTQRREVTFKAPDFVVTGTCGDNYTWSLEDGVFWAEGGDNLTYSLDLATGHLIVEGTGGIGVFQAWASYAAKIKTVELRPGVRGIGYEAFLNCVNLESIQIPDTVTFVSGNAFENCRSLKSVELPDSVETFGEYVFQGCTALERVVLSPKITALGRCIFSGCSALTSVENTAQILSYSIYCFNNCTSLQTLDINPDAAITKNAFRECPAGAAYDND